MSGHNKWSKIKHKKAAEDARKSKVFSKLSKLIASEARKADGHRDAPGLQTAIETAKKENMPKDNIERAIERGFGGESGNDEALTYELYGPGGVAMVIDILTDNRNRAAQEVRTILKDFNLELANPGAAAWAFEKENGEWKAQTTVAVGEEDKKKIDSIVEALEESDEVQKVYTNVG